MFAFALAAVSEADEEVTTAVFPHPRLLLLLRSPSFFSVCVWVCVEERERIGEKRREERGDNGNDEREGVEE